MIISNTSVGPMSLLAGFRCGSCALSVFVCVFVGGHAVASEVTKEVSVLEVDKVIARVARSNPTIEDARLNWLISKSDAEVVEGGFHPDIVSTYSYAKYERQNDIETQGITQGINRSIGRAEDASFGVEGLLYTGANYSVSYSLDESRTNYDNSTNFLGSRTRELQDPEYRAFVGLTLTQPLLKGTWAGAPKQNIKIAAYQSLIALHQYRQQLLEGVYDAELAYWSLVFAQDAYALLKKSVETAKTIYQDNNHRYKVGKTSENDLIEAKAGLALRQSELAEHEQKLNAAKKQLLLFLAYDSGKVNDVVASDSFLNQISAAESVAILGHEMFEFALNVFPNYLLQKTEVEKEEIRVAYESNHAKPEVNLVVTYGQSGLGGSSSEARQAADTGDEDEWSIGLEMRVPITKKRSSSRLKVAKLRLRQAEQRLGLIRTEITAALKSALKNQKVIEQRSKHVSSAVEIGERLLEVELTKMATGKSDVRKVYEVEESLLSAQMEEIETRLSYKKVNMQIGFVGATLLSKRGLEKIIDGKPVLMESVAREYEY